MLLSPLNSVDKAKIVIDILCCNTYHTAQLQDTIQQAPSIGHIQYMRWLCRDLCLTDRNLFNLYHKHAWSIVVISMGEWNKRLLDPSRCSLFFAGKKGSGRLEFKIPTLLATNHIYIRLWNDLNSISRFSQLLSIAYCIMCRPLVFQCFCTKLPK